MKCDDNWFACQAGWVGKCMEAKDCMKRSAERKFGEGIITNLEGSGAQARVEVNFEYHGSKWLVMAYANLQPA